MVKFGKAFKFKLKLWSSKHLDTAHHINFKVYKLDNNNSTRLCQEFHKLCKTNTFKNIVNLTYTDKASRFVNPWGDTDNDNGL